MLRLAQSGHKENRIIPAGDCWVAVGRIFITKVSQASCGGTIKVRRQGNSVTMEYKIKNKTKNKQRQRIKRTEKARGTSPSPFLRFPAPQKLKGKTDEFFLVFFFLEKNVMLILLVFVPEIFRPSRKKKGMETEGYPCQAEVPKTTTLMKKNFSSLRGSFPERFQAPCSGNSCSQVPLV
jgi:hypothetical protein